MSARSELRSPPRSLSEEAVTLLVTHRAEFARFLAARIANPTDAEDILQESLVRAIKHGGSIERGERIVGWFYRVLRNALTDHYRNTSALRRRNERLATEAAATLAGSADCERAICACLEGVLGTIRPQYAELLRRVDLKGEMRVLVARELKLSSGAFDVMLHRARAALRRQLEIFCGACSRERCLACACDQTRRPVPQRKTVRSRA